MAIVYFLYSKSIDKFYIGSCINIEVRLNDHLLNKYNSAFTIRANDWEVYYKIEQLEFIPARNSLTPTCQF